MKGSKETTGQIYLLYRFHTLRRVVFLAAHPEYIARGLASYRQSLLQDTILNAAFALSHSPFPTSFVWATQSEQTHLQYASDHSTVQSALGTIQREVNRYSVTDSRDWPHELQHYVDSRSSTWLDDIIHTLAPIPLVVGVARGVAKSVARRAAYGFPELPQGRERQAALGYPQLKRGLATRSAQGFPELVKGQATRATLGFPELARGRATQAKQGYPKLAQARATQAKQGYPALARGLATRAAQGFRGLKTAIATRCRNDARIRLECMRELGMTPAAPGTTIARQCKYCSAEMSADNEPFFTPGGKYLAKETRNNTEFFCQCAARNPNKLRVLIPQDSTIRWVRWTKVKEHAWNEGKAMQHVARKGRQRKRKSVPGPT